MEGTSFFDEGFAGILPDGYQSQSVRAMKSQVEERNFLIETDRQFYCKKIGKQTQASLCAKHCKISPPCQECTFGQTAKNHFKKENQFSCDGCSDDNNCSINMSNFEEYVPSPGFGLYAALREQTICFPVMVVKNFELDDFKYAKLMFDQSSMIVGVKFFTLKEKKQSTHKLIRPQSNSMRVSFLGFRTFYNIKETGRFAILTYDKDKQILFIDLKEKLNCDE